MLRRVELAWPVTDASLRQRIVDECLVAYLQDDRDAWDLMPDGHYKRVKGAGETQGPRRARRLDGALCRARRRKSRS